MTDRVPEPRRRVTEEMRDPDTPRTVEVEASARKPEEDPILDVEVEPDRTGPARHRLVTIGDSLTHGFQSGAIFNTDLSYPAIIAYELGWYDQFRRPSYPGFGGLPLNIEFLLRDLQARYGDSLNPFEVPLALFRARQFMAELEDYYERGAGSRPPNVAGINHNLAVYGWDLRDTLDRTARSCAEAIGQPKDNWLNQLIENANERAALRVLPSATEELRDLTPLGAARRLGEDGGIETLIVLLGSNNALGAVTGLRVEWSGPGYDTVDGKRPFTVWRPEHFGAEFGRVVDQVRQIQARHVIWGTVPHVTIAPIARGVGDKVEPGSRYFPYYTRPWINDPQFNPSQDPKITSQEARAIDSAIDQYNQHITATVAQARQGGLDWYLFDLAGVLDRLAYRRYIEDPNAQPAWWRPYELPAVLAALDPIPDSRFLAWEGGGHRIRGGLFSLDGVHATTIGYGIIAQELITIMRRAGVTFHQADGRTPRADPVTVDFQRLLRRDTLLAAPLALVGSGLEILGWADEALDLVKRTLSFGT
jgi:hypothetical protein